MVTRNPFTSSRIASLVEKVRVATRQQLVEVTLRKTAENQASIMAKIGREAPIRRLVDGSPTKPVTEAQLFTHTEFELLGHVIDEALQLLVQRSPIGPPKHGHYKDDHWLFVNGERRDATVEVNSTVSGAVDVGPGDRIVILNARPYSRKIEGGPRNRSRSRLTDRRPGLSVQAPSGVYEITARDLQSRFGNIAVVKFAYHVYDGANSIGVGGGRSNRFPALEIRSL